MAVVLFRKTITLNYRSGGLLLPAASKAEENPLLVQVIA
jgi:hypothetical protein